ncbi:MAG: preprotein translocase subunit SecY [Candidatus Paceibacterota bacterium]
MWYDKIVQIFKVEELRNKILFVLGVFVVFRLMANIPIPIIEIERLQEFFANSQVFGLLNVFTGGALSKLSIVMLGIGPYITSVIIMQLLTMIFPRLERLYKEEGQQGKQKFNQYGRYLTVPLAFLQGFGMLTLLQRRGAIGNLGILQMLSALTTAAAGTMFLVWLGELISEKGIGNGVSLLIFAGIIARFPSNMQQLVVGWDPSQIPSYLAFFIISVLIIAGVVIVNEAKRNIPVSYSKRVKGRKVYGGSSTYLPLSVNPAGVIPIIFALAILLFPGMLSSMLSGVGNEIISNAAQALGAFFQNPWVYNIFYFLLVSMFTYFYTSVTFDPNSIADNLKKMGGFIPGIRPGESTTEYLYFVLYRVLPFGAVFLASIAIMPSIIAAITGVQSFQFLVGGTSVLIVVSVVLESMRQVKSQLQMREYETF